MQPSGASGTTGITPRGVFACLALLAGLVAFGSARDTAAQGLKLQSATEKTTEEYDKPNPHFELGCEECHGTKPPEGATLDTVKFINGEEGNVGLCYTCHNPSENIHPINVNPDLGTPPVIAPADFPLEWVGAAKGTVVCSTCHFIHTRTAGLKLLRGFPVSSLPEDVKKARFTDRRQLCMACHGEKLKEKSPHKGKVADDAKQKRSCSFCHAKEPKEGEPVVFTKNPLDLCDFCHAATTDKHYLLVNPFADPGLPEDVKQAKLPLFQGDYTCVSCHNPHGGTGEEKFLRKEFVQLALKSRRVRPHFMKAFCEACHTVRPKTAKGAPGAQPLAEIPLRTNDANALCNRCHESGLSKANAHPIKVVPDKFKQRIPAGWPLQNGSLTCLTCHTGGDSPVFDPANPTFLRGAPYEARNGMCWNCHLREEFAAVNPHEKVQKLEGCEFCHEVKPDLVKFRAGQKQDVKFKGDIVILCIRCHDDSAHPANHEHTGMPSKELMAEKGIKIPKEFPLDRMGRIHCATCHNPHANGELRGAVPGQMICSACHPY